MPEVIMPKMGDAMEEGTLLKWLKSEGDEVSEGDAIAEFETDKVTLELEAEDSGTLAQLIADEGQDIPVGEAIAFIQGEGEEVPERAAGGGAEEAEEEGGDGAGAVAVVRGGERGCGDHPGGGIRLPRRARAAGERGRGARALRPQPGLGGLPEREAGDERGPTGALHGG